MGVTDIGLIVQAAAIDRAGRNLLDRASAPGTEKGEQPPAPTPSYRNPAAFAATDTPTGDADLALRASATGKTRKDAGHISGRASASHLHLNPARLVAKDTSAASARVEPGETDLAGHEAVRRRSLKAPRRAARR